MQIKPKSKSRKNKKKKQRGAQEEGKEEETQQRNTSDEVADVSGDEDNADKDETEASSRKRKGGPADNIDIEGAAERTPKKLKAVEDDRDRHDSDYQADKIETKDIWPVKHRTPVDSDANQRNVKHVSFEKNKGCSNRMSQQRVEYGKFAKKVHDKDNRFVDKRHSPFNGRIRKEKNIGKIGSKVEIGKTGSEGGISDIPKVDPIPWDQLTAKQKKNRRNAMIKKRKKAEIKEMKIEKATKHKSKFQPFDELQMSEARMKAYGLNPNRVKGSLVYSSGLPGKNKMNVRKEKS